MPRAVRRNTWRPICWCRRGVRCDDDDGSRAAQSDCRAWRDRPSRRQPHTYDLAGDAAPLVPELVARCEEIRRFLQDRAAVPSIPPKLRLLSWKLKPPPVMVETVSVVSDPANFAAETLKQLAVAVADPAWDSIIPHLLDRLAQVGVALALTDRQDIQESQDLQDSQDS